MVRPVKQTVKVNLYRLIDNAVELGVEIGLNRAYKHTESPDRAFLVDRVADAVMSEICELIDFDEESTK